MSLSSQKLRLIHAGVGGHGRSWGRGVLPQSEDFEVVALVDPDEAVLREEARRIGLSAERCFPDLTEALAAVEAEAVLSVTPPKVHPIHTEAAAIAGRHLLVEKPLAEDLATAKRMVERFEAAGLQLCVAQQRRYDADMLALRDAVRAAPLGPIGHGHIDFYIPADFTGSFRQEMPHVLLVDMCVHHIDLIRSVTGRNIARVFAHDFNPAWSWYGRDAALKMILWLDDASVFSYSGDWSGRGRKTSWQGDWRLQCAEGAIRLGAETDGIVLERSDRGFDPPFTREILPIPPAMPAQQSVLQRFARAIRTGAPAQTSGRDNLHTLAAVFAAVQSAETGEVVDVPEIEPQMNTDAHR